MRRTLSREEQAVRWEARRRKRKVVAVILMTGLAAAMLWTAAGAASLVDKLLLGLGGVVLAGYVVFWELRSDRRNRHPALLLAALACSPLVIYPLGAIIALRFLVFPSDGASQTVGIASGLLFLSPIFLLLLIASMFVLGRYRP